MKQLVCFATVAALISGLACSSPEPSSADESAAGKADAPETGSWRQRITKESELLAATEPARYAALSRMQGYPTRKGFLRLRGKDMHHPAAASVFLVRYLAETDAEVRAALVAALPRTGGVYEDAIIELYELERDENVRVAMMAALGKSKSEPAARQLGQGLEDTSAIVRLEAAVALQRHPIRGETSSQLEGATLDPDPAVRRAAVTALGFQRAAATANTLMQATNDGDGAVRLAALRALASIDESAARAAASALMSDGDTRVEAEAREILDR